MSAEQTIPETLSRFSLFDTLRGRRSRRFGTGMTIPDGPLQYSSRYEPFPLSESERALLVFAAVGVTGWNLGIPHTESGSSDQGANYPIRHAGRTSPSAAGAESSEVLIADDSGVYISQTREASAELIEAASRATSIDELVQLSADTLVKISDSRLTLPAAPPFVSAHNRWSALQPGSTLIVPIVDMSEHLLNFLSIFTGEGVIVWDVGTDEPIGDPTELIRRGALTPGATMPIEAFERLVYQQGTVEAGLIAYNAQLMLQAMGLGGWLYGGVDSNALLGAHARDGVRGFGFEFQERSAGGVPNPVGLPGYFETLSPPFTRGPAEAVEQFAARKFGDGGLYETPQAGPYKNNSTVKTLVGRYDDATLEYFVSVVEGLTRRYGGFPGTFPTVLTSVYLQAQHVDEGFYNKFHKPEALLETHRTHVDVWHGGAQPRLRE